MKWNEFKTKLSENTELHLHFEFAKNQKVNPSFHITEIKQANFTAVDCGGKMNAWTEVILQLWEPNTTEIGCSMQVSKAMSIIDLVEKTLPINPNGIVKIEFGNDLFETRLLLPQDFEIINDEITVKLVSDKTQCKAIGRGESCGTPKPKLKITNLQNSHCYPESGCC